MKENQPVNNVEQRRDNALQRALSTPPKPKTTQKKGKPASSSRSKKPAPIASES
jgi:hypothetical protein